MKAMTESGRRTFVWHVSC